MSYCYNCKYYQETTDGGRCGYQSDLVTDDFACQYFDLIKERLDEEMPIELQTLDSILDNIRSTWITKKGVYGDSYSISRSNAPVPADHILNIIQLKLARLECINRAINEEGYDPNKFTNTIYDTLIDISVYCILELMVLKQ